jgi:hypothetical protein
MQLYPEGILPHLTTSAPDTYEELELWNALRQFFSQAPRVFFVVQARQLGQDFTSKLFNVANHIIFNPESEVKFVTLLMTE